MNNIQKIPTCIGIILDGNRRWAKERGLPSLEGHRRGFENVEPVILAARDLGIKHIVVFAFSTENWKRPKHEVSALFKLLENYIDREFDTLVKNNIRLSVIGRSEGLPQNVQDKLKKVIDRTRDNNALVLNLALNYGGRTEIVDAVRKIIKEIEAGRARPEDIDENSFGLYLYTKDIPDPDLLIRTSGEMRISNFLLWQISYAEIYVTEKLWPDFKKNDFIKAVKEYQKRDRRYGG